MAPDVLVSGGERPPRLHRSGALLVVLALLAVAAWFADTAVRRSEVDRLLTRAAADQSTIAYTDGRVAATINYTLPLLFSVNTTAHVRAGLRDLVQQSAGEQAPALEQELKATRAVRVLPWHGDGRRAQRLLVAYLDARLRYLRAASADARVLYVRHPELEQRLEDAREAFLRAADAGTDRRVIEVFAGGTHPALSR